MVFECNCIMLVETTHLTEFEYYFACTRKGVHLYFVMSSLSSSLFFLSFSLTPHIHLIILISVRFIFNSCSTFIGQVSLPCIRQLTQVAYTLPFSFNENPFPVRIDRHSRNFFQADLTLAVTAESHPLSAFNTSPK